jgi:hypothetical protein
MGAIQTRTTNRRRWARAARGGACATILWLLGCTGQIGALGDRDGEGRDRVLGQGGAGAGAAAGAPGAGAETSVAGAPTSGRDPDEAGYGEDVAGLSDLPAPASRAPRLTHLQWQNTVTELFGIEQVGLLAQEFRSDPLQGGFLFDNDGATLSVDDALWGSYQRASADIASMVTGDPERLAAILPAGVTEDEAGAREFIVQFGARAHRRPLGDAEIEDYLAVYRAAAGAYLGVSSDFQAGIRLLIEAFLQSPHFIYRIEPSTTQVGNVIPLDGYEIASRLSYMIWNSMPDDELFVAAAAGQLTSAAEAALQAERMLEDPRAQAVVVAFHEKLLDFERYAQISPATAAFPDAPPNLADLARRESELFVDSVFESGGGFKDLLTSSRTFVNDGLAQIYGVSGSFGADFSPVTLDASRRKGFLTQVGFLASHATSLHPDPIHRGVFLAKRIICARINAPPDDIPPLPLPDEGQTNRETVEALTENPETVCATCHKTIINPLGFPFENYDAVGGYRTQDNGYPVNAATAPFIDGMPTQVQNAVELAAVLSESPQAHQCYTRYWLEFAYGRAYVDTDQNLIQRLGVTSAEEGISMKDLIVSLVKTEAFMTRSTEELP